MFKYKSLIVILLSVLVSCNTKNKKIEHEEEFCDIVDHPHVLDKTDSILVLADEEFKIIKQHQVEQRVFVDSLEYTIEIEQFAINDLNKEVHRRDGVDKDLQLTKEQLEKALITCKNKENELKELNEKFDLESEQFMNEIEYYIDREIKLITIYNHKIDSLVFIIDSLPRGRRFRNR
jgi:hypothetical protein